MAKNIILCADDYAQTPAISQAIINLITRKRISATTCLVNSCYWLEHAAWLKPFINEINIGLHFNLTLGNPISDMPQLANTGIFPTLSKLLLNSYLNKIKEQEIYDELNQQIDRFEKVLGKVPDFIDGHQHIHCLPGICDALLACYNERLKGKDIWIRNICPGHKQYLLDSPAALKKISLYLLGGKRLKNLLIKQNIKHNTSFSGVYNFNTAMNYSQLFPLFLDNTLNNGLIMCHPGLSHSNFSDPIANNRIAEYEYLASDEFLADCDLNQIKISLFNY